ncbi:MAG: hypothetical protein ABSH01_13250 [Terriglobia bacterium]|jgi:hypothetical protein
MKYLANPYASFMTRRAHYKIEAHMNSSRSVEFGIKTPPCREQTIVGYTSPAADTHEELEIFVIFTDHSGTLAALRMARHLGDKLDARLRLLMPFEVPYTLPLTRPAVPVGFLEEQLHALASKIPMDIAAHIYLCRDKCRSVRLILKPRSIVILGGRKRWWSVEQKLASVLKKDGHHVIFAESR